MTEPAAKSSATLARELAQVQGRISRLRAEVDPAEVVVTDLTGQLMAGRAVDDQLDLARRALDSINNGIRHLDATASVLDGQRREAIERERQAEAVARREVVLAAVGELRRRAAIYSDDLQRATSSARKLAAAAAAVREALPVDIWRDGKLGLPRVLGAGLRTLAEREARRIGGEDPIPGIDPRRDFSVPLPALADEFAALETTLRRALGDPDVPPLPVAAPDPPRDPRDAGRALDITYGRERREEEARWHEQAGGASFTGVI